MGQISWGRPKIEVSKLDADGNPTVWVQVDNPAEDTSKLNAEAGDKKEAKGEGGEIVDSKTGKNKYTFEFELYAKKGKSKPIEDEDGVVAGNYAVRLTPEDTTQEGFIIDKSSVSVTDGWDAAIGKKWKYTFNGLDPKAGRICKPYMANALVASPTSLVFDSVANTAGKTITVASEGNLTAATSADSWITPTKATKVATVKVSANTSTEARTGSVALTADGKTVNVEVIQAGATA